MTAGNRQRVSMLLIGCSIVLSAGAQLLMKAGMLELGNLDMMHTLKISPETMAHLLPVLAWVLTGLMLYAISMLTWMGALAKCDLSLAYPLLGLSYVLVYGGAVIWPRLHETVSVSKTIGILLILAGVFLVTRSKNSRLDSQGISENSSNMAK
jgi:undecaprenyl phosphate-alpha-L-ara4N flippase subunit ArnF